VDGTNFHVREPIAITKSSVFQSYLAHGTLSGIKKFAAPLLDKNDNLWHSML